MQFKLNLSLFDLCNELISQIISRLKVIGIHNYWLILLEISWKYSEVWVDLKNISSMHFKSVA